MAYGKSMCASQAEDAYLIDLTLPAPGTVCESDSRRPCVAEGPEPIKGGLDRDVRPNVAEPDMVAFNDEVDAAPSEVKSTLCRQETLNAVPAESRGREEGSNHPGWMTVLLALLGAVFRLPIHATVASPRCSWSSAPTALPRVPGQAASPGDPASRGQNRSQKWPGWTFSEHDQPAARQKPEFLTAQPKRRHTRGDADGAV